MHENRLPPEFGGARIVGGHTVHCGHEFHHGHRGYGMEFAHVHAGHPHHHVLREMCEAHGLGTEAEAGILAMHEVRGERHEVHRIAEILKERGVGTELGSAERIALAASLPGISGKGGLERG